MPIKTAEIWNSGTAEKIVDISCHLLKNYFNIWAKWLKPKRRIGLKKLLRTENIYFSIWIFGMLTVHSEVQANIREKNKAKHKDRFESACVSNDL